LDCVAVVCAQDLLCAETVERIHAAGMRALAYTVNDPATAGRLAAAGVDGLITDRVDRQSPDAVGFD
jgi:glycerophosphoryl diester phosphodiesterase